MKKLLFTAMLLIVSMPVLSADPLIFTRCERTTGTHDITADVTVGGVTQSITKTFGGIDAFDFLVDVSRKLGNVAPNALFKAPCDLVHDDGVGNETVIYSCSTRPDSASCAAFDGNMSFDGSKIAFSVFEGSITGYPVPLYEKDLDPNADTPNNFIRYEYLPSKHLSATRADIYEYDIATQQTTQVTQQSPWVFNFGPIYTDDNRLAFLSTQQNQYGPIIFKTTAANPTVLWYSIDTDGNNLRLDSTHQIAIEQRGTVMSEGHLLFPTDLFWGAYPFRHDNSTPGNFGTLDNHTAYWRQGFYGEQQFAVFGQHVEQTTVTSYGSKWNALRWPKQISDGRACGTSYYRRNNYGLGESFCFTPEQFGREGVRNTANGGETYLPTDVIRLATWDRAGDKTATVDVNFTDLFYGKTGHPFPLTGNGIGLSYGAGGCSSILSAEPFTALGIPYPPHIQNGGGMRQAQFYEELQNHRPGVVGCNVDLYKLTAIPSLLPSDMTPLKTDPNWHFIMASPAVPYSAIHGVQKPAQLPRPDEITTIVLSEEAGSPFGLFGAASTEDREAAPCDGFATGLTSLHACGTEMFPIVDSDIFAVRILVPEPNDGSLVSSTPPKVSRATVTNHWGMSLSVIGEIPVRNKNPDGTPVMEQDGIHEDTSFAVRLPADMPFIVQALDKKGRTLFTDFSPQATKPGEEKTCGGCHIHDGQPRRQFSQSFAATPSYNVQTIGIGPNVTLIDGADAQGNPITRTVAGRSVAYDFDDVYPIFQTHCAACHSGATPAGDLNLSNDNSPTNRWATTDNTWHRLAHNNQQTGIINKATYLGSTGLKSPWASKFLHRWCAACSPVYWYAANERTDNRADADLTMGVAFNPAHPTVNLTTEELGMLGRWIDLGAPGGTQEKNDRLRPTLTLVADHNGSQIDGLRVGVTDSKSGINPASVSVCIVGTTCDNLITTPVLDGVSVVNLAAPITNPATLIRASVSDNSGNTTELEFTAEYLMRFNVSGGSNPPPPPLTINVGADAAINEGATFSRTITVSGGTGTGRTYDIEWETGATLESGTITDGAADFSISRLMPDGDKVQTVTVLVSDSGNNTATGNFVLTTNDVAPTGTVDGSGQATTNQQYSIGFITTDPGDDLVTGYFVDWGDAVSNNALTHTYTLAGTYTVTGYAINEDGQHLIGTHQVVVTDPLPCIATIEPLSATDIRLNTTNCNVVP
ncbi:MAG: hypothetical protein MRK00_16320 [Nitrosomonas sp.]|nr:hypothetical protein [Nitrosomonas sp.]